MHTEVMTVTEWTIALKRILTPARIVMLILTVVLTLAAGRTGTELALHPCGLVCEDDGENADFVCERLAEKGFVLYNSREEMSADIEGGKLDCGAILCEGIGKGIDSGELDGSVIMCCSPMSFMTEGYKADILAVLYTATAPVRTANAAAKAGVELTPDEVKAELDNYYAGGLRFHFETETVSGESPMSVTHAPILKRAASAILIFALLLPALRGFCADTVRMGSRIGYAKAKRYVLLPEAVLMTVLCILSGLASGETVPVIAYCLALTVPALLSSRIPDFAASLVIALWLLGSLAVYPVYYDLAESFSFIETLRLFFPPCWFESIVRHPTAALTLSVSANAALILILRRQDR